MRKISIRNLVLSGLFMAFGLILPFFVGQIPSIGRQLLPMHIPVLIAGFVLGWPYGLLVGFITPLFRSLLFGMPAMFPMAVSMAFELAVYGFTAGLLYNLLPKKKINIYVALIISMICGRIVWGAVSLLLYGLSSTTFTWEIFMAGAFINAAPGIIIQLIIIPIIIISLERAKVISNGK